MDSGDEPILNIELDGAELDIRLVDLSNVVEHQKVELQRSRAKKKPKKQQMPQEIYLIDMGPEDGVVWCDTSSPEEGMVDSTAIKYTRVAGD